MPLGAGAVLALSPPTYESRKIVDAEELKGDSIFTLPCFAILNLRFRVLQPIGDLASFQLNFSQQAPVRHVAQGGILGQLELLFGSSHIQ